MIVLDEEYVINANDNCYTLERKILNQEEIVKNKNKTKDIEGYYSTIESALHGYLKHKTRKYISKNTNNTLSELLDFIQSTSKELKDKFGKV